MWDVFRSLLSALPSAAASPYAFAAYALVVVAYVVTAWRVTRNKNLLENLEKLPSKERAKALEIEMGGVHLASGISPEQWVRPRIHPILFVRVSCNLRRHRRSLLDRRRWPKLSDLHREHDGLSNSISANPQQLIGDAELKNLQEAIDFATKREFERALDVFNRVPEAARVAAYWNDVGAVRESLNDQENARLAYQKTLDLRPDFEPAKVNLARLDKRATPDATRPAKAETRSPDASPAINLLSPYEVGQDVRVPSADWIKIVSGKDDDYIWVHHFQDVEGTFPLRGSALINSFAVLIKEQNSENPKDIAFFAGDSAGGEFRLIRQCTLENILKLNMQYQECKFPETRARYIKIKLLSNFGGIGLTLRQIRVLGQLAR